MASIYQYNNLSVAKQCKNKGYTNASKPQIHMLLYAVESSLNSHAFTMSRPHLIDNRVGDWQQSLAPFRTHGLSEVVVFTPQKVSQGVDFMESITEIFIKLWSYH